MTLRKNLSFYLQPSKLTLDEKSVAGYRRHENAPCTVIRFNLRDNMANQNASQLKYQDSFTLIRDP